MQSAPSGTGEVEPFLDGEIGVGVPALAWRQLLEGGGEHADRHVDGLEWLGSARQTSFD